jgi:protein TonB
VTFRFPILLFLSALIHALVFWMAAADSPPVALVRRGEISVDFVVVATQQPQANAELKTQATPDLPSMPPPVPAPPEPPEPIKKEKAPAPLPPAPKEPEKVEPMPIKKEKPREKDSPAPAEPKQVEQKAPRQEEEKPKTAMAVKSGAETREGTPLHASVVAAPKEQGVKTGVRRLDNRKPDYPEAARVRNLQGNVMIVMEVSAEGNVVSVMVHESSGHPILDDAALRFSQTLRFIPARSGSIPVAASVYLPIRFRLD